MSEEKGAERPRQVTMAVVLGVISSVVLVLGLFETLGRLRTPDMRESVDEFLAEAPGSSLGVDTAQVVDLMRVLVLVAGALAAMGLVFAIFVLQRHRPARIGFTVVAALLLLTVPVTGLMPFFLGVAAFLLWSQPARAWYDGRAPVASGPGGRRSVPMASQTDQGSGGSTRSDAWSPQPPAQPPAQPAQQPEHQPEQQPVPARDEETQPVVAGPPPFGQSYGQPQDQAQDEPQDQAQDEPRDRAQEQWQGQPQGQPQWQGQPQDQWQGAYGQSPYGAAGYPAHTGRDPDKRPMSVTLAAVFTWIGAGATALLMLVFMAVLGGGGDAFVEEFDRAARQSDVNLSADEVLAVGWAVAGVCLAWSLIAVVLAVLAFRRNNVARFALAVSAVMAALFSLFAIISVLSAVTLLLAAAAGILLFTGGANEWFSRRSRDGRNGPPPGYPYPGYPQQPYQQPQYPEQSPTGRNKPW